jgi:hypothetical protein
MHGEAGFQATRRLLAERGFEEDEVVPYTGEAFGSWAVTLGTLPRMRIVWEAKDEWAIIDVELLDVPRPRGYSPWRDLWVGKRPEDLTPEAVVQALENLRDFKSAAIRAAGV